MAKKKTFKPFTTLLYVINSIVATVLLLSYALPYISPKNLPAFTVLSLLVPFLIIVNVLFLIYWLVKLNKNFMLSGVILGIGFLISSPFFKISSKKVLLNDDVKIMSYNVRMMNFYKQIDKEGVADSIVDFINEKQPDILAVQEFHNSEKRTLNYPYKYFVPRSKYKNFGLAIFSKYKIVHKGSLDFKESANNAIFVDILKGNDTVRIYNVHLQSLRLNPNKENFGQENSEKLFHRLENGFQKQAEQTELVLAHQENFKGKKIICADMNNTAYSWVYKQLSEGKKDTFIEAGNGLGKSFRYFFPMRIDFILVDDRVEVNHHETFGKKLSDHYPIMTRLTL